MEYGLIVFCDRMASQMCRGLIPVLAGLLLAGCDTGCSDATSPTLAARNATAETLAVPNSTILRSPFTFRLEHTARIALGPSVLPDGKIDAPSPNSELAFRAIIVVNQIKADIRNARNSQQFNNRELATYGDTLRSYERAGEVRDLPKRTACEMLGMRTIAGAAAALVRVQSLRKDGQPIIGWMYQKDLN